MYLHRELAIASKDTIKIDSETAQHRGYSILDLGPNPHDINLGIEFHIIVVGRESKETEGRTYLVFIVFVDSCRPCFCCLVE